MQRISYLKSLSSEKNSPAFNELIEHHLRVNGCPVTAAMRVIGGKWKPILLYLITHDVKRFGEMIKLVVGISKKVLTEQLRELEADGIISRKVYAEVPPKVEYDITEKGKTLIPVLGEICEWGLKKAPLPAGEG